MNLAIMNKATTIFSGIDLNAVSKNFELKKTPNQFCIGEMLNWDTPTGGYLLQGCASMGFSLGSYLNDEA